MTVTEFVWTYGPLIYAAVLVPVLLAVIVGIVREILRGRRDDQARNAAREDVRRRAARADEGEATLLLYPSGTRVRNNVMAGRS